MRKFVGYFNTTLLLLVEPAYAQQGFLQSRLQPIKMVLKTT